MQGQGTYTRARYLHKGKRQQLSCSWK